MYCLVFANVDEVLDQHPERGTPIPDVVFPYNAVPDELEQPYQAVADNRGPKVADMHRFRDVWGRVVHNHLLQRARELRAQCRRGQRHIAKFGRQELARQGQIDKPGPGYFGALEKISEALGGGPRHHFLGDLAGRPA